MQEKQNERRNGKEKRSDGRKEEVKKSSRNLVALFFLLGIPALLWYYHVSWQKIATLAFVVGVAWVAFLVFALVVLARMARSVAKVVDGWGNEFLQMESSLKRALQPRRS